MPHIIVGTAGHIDHGKTALVKALTGIDTDRLKEEKARGITIDLGFANLAVDAQTTIGFVDVPGHERFIKNMLAGAGGIDAVMLVVAADESVMPQTREHLAICSLLRVQTGLIVLTKIDAADRDTADVAEMEVQELLKGTFLERAPILRVSARTGEGIPELVRALASLAASAAPRDPSRIFRLPVDRAFTMKGFGAVAAGTLVAGRVRRDDEVELLPDRRTARVRGIQVHGEPSDEAVAGQRTALNLQRVELADIRRGMVVTVPGIFSPTTTFDVHVELLPDADPLAARKRIRFHVGTTELIGYAVLLGQDRLEPGASAFARIRVETPAFALPGDRFIIRQYSPMRTLGGGEILDAHPPRLRRSDPAIVDRLRVLRDGTLHEKLLRFVEERGEAATDVSALIARTGLSAEVLRVELRRLIESGAARPLAQAPLAAASGRVFDAAAARALDVVGRFHASEPLVKGIGREDLKARALPRASDEFFRAVLDHLVAAKMLALDQDVVHEHGRSVTLQGGDERVREQLVARFRELGLQAPPPDEVIASVTAERSIGRKIVQLLVKDGTLAKVNEGLVVDRAALEKLVADVRARKAQSATLGVGDFKALTGLSRKFAVPLLEYLDAQRITRRVGDERVIL
ncbi:MAG TPA: selenocysteine-specific translation elongation factor [Vicinamibacterales bacterium]|nr:selenocysteine-specific translation elongation factor [Vicinamibacterales bacterium]